TICPPPRSTLFPYTTLFRSIRTLKWDEELCKEVGVPLEILPEIRPSIGSFGHVRSAGSLAKVPITGVLGDQQAALFGQAAFAERSEEHTSELQSRFDLVCRL